MHYGHFDSSSLWHCNFNPYSESYNNIYPKLLEQYDVERSTYENFIGEVNSLIKILKSRLTPSSMIRYIILVHIVLCILTMGMWLVVFGLWFLIHRMITERKAIKETERTKNEIERLIANKNSSTFHPKGLDVITIFDIEKEKRSGVESFLESYVLFQTCKTTTSTCQQADAEPETVRAQPGAVMDHSHYGKDLEEDADYYYYH